MSNTSKLNENLLLKQLIAGNEKAFTSLFTTYQDDLFKYSLKMVKFRVYAAEIVQDVFLSIWLKRASLDPQLSIKSYLFAATRNKTITFLNKAAKNQKLCDEIFYKSQKSINSTERYIREDELEVIKKEALDLLPPRRRQIFEMSRNDHKSYEEIAKELGISPHTVRNHMSLALETLRDFLLNNKDIALAFVLFSRNWM
ncbi:RNA polymerase sigma factor [uncultured Polaribacter sp.]|uniref:RNA polymerase sigma factor n=1 Tax=uncultured Polaribacter sp. TaxID=174711 RepID=UPI00260FB270|nr:RNA polymerase sigma-70 factor [uncultured Polaribacter sp.]